MSAATDTNHVTEGIHHAGLTVPDLAAARTFFVDALGFETVGEIPDYPAVFLSDGVVMLTLFINTFAAVVRESVPRTITASRSSAR